MKLPYTEKSATYDECNAFTKLEANVYGRCQARRPSGDLSRWFLMEERPRILAKQVNVSP